MPRSDFIERSIEASTPIHVLPVLAWLLLLHRRQLAARVAHVFASSGVECGESHQFRHGTCLSILLLLYTTICTATRCCICGRVARRTGQWRWRAHRRWFAHRRRRAHRRRFAHRRRRAHRWRRAHRRRFTHRWRRAHRRWFTHRWRRAHRWWRAHRRRFAHGRRHAHRWLCAQFGFRVLPATPAVTVATAAIAQRA